MNPSLHNPTAALRTWWQRTLLMALLLTAVFATSTQAQTTVQLGSGTGSSTYFPNYYNYNYSYTQTIYTVAEMNAAGAAFPGNITKLRYLPGASVATTNWKDWVVYIGNTTKVGFTGASDYIAPSAMVQVFNGTLPSNVTSGTWMEITLSTPFYWDGISNIVVAVDENTPTYGSLPSWKGYSITPSTGSKGIYFYQDSGDILPTAPTATSQSTSNTVAQIQFAYAAIPCTGTPVAGTLPANTPTCMGASSTLSPTGGTLAAGLTYLWEQSTDGGATWANAGGTNTNATYTTAPYSGPVSYRRTTTCTASSSSATTNIAAVTLMAAPPYLAFTGSYTQSFESWSNRCSTTDVPGSNWLNTPAATDSSWRRNDQGASAGWTAAGSGLYTPTFTNGAYSA
ncbi:MAG: hypothetical protein JST38_08355, partial [Bacteroidetes bacterium]|nr:hypothetical protein [Bacteroidota bacterium]